MFTRIKNQNPFETIADQNDPIKRHTIGSSRLTEFDVKSNAPIDWIKLSKKQEKIIATLKTTANPVLKEGLEELEKVNKNALGGVFYGTISEKQRLALDHVKFAEIQEHFKLMGSSYELDLIIHDYQSKGISYTEAHVGEVLSKALAYLDPKIFQEGKTLEIPIHREGRTPPFEMVKYAVQAYKMKGSELPYFSLKAENAPPWVVIRGTDPNLIGKSVTDISKKSSLQSIIADFIDRDGISNQAVDNSMGDFMDLLSELSQKGPVNLAGHSLGGEYVQHLAARLAEDQGINIGTTYAYGSPGVHERTNRFYKIAKEKPVIINFNKVGDPVPKAGKYLIGDHFRIDQFNASDRADVAHRVSDLHKPHTIQRVDVEAEKKVGMRRLVEGLRREVVGNALRALDRIRPLLDNIN